MTPTAVLFDLDDTLFDHRHCTREALTELRSRHVALQTLSPAELGARHAQILERLHLAVLAGGLSVDAARVQRFHELFAEAGAPLTAAQATDAAAAYRAAYLSAWRLVPGALPLLSALRGRVRIGVVTNNVVSEQTRKIEVLGLRPFLDATIISEAVGVTKPDPRIFAMALSQLSTDARDAVMVGDSWVADVTAARAAGMRAVWFNPERHARPEAADVRELASLEPPEAAVAVILAV